MSAEDDPMERWLEHYARASFRRSGDTAHDLKTPLNVAVLNLELLRMRLRKLGDGSDDEKVLGYTSSIEVELRRMARIFDAYFVYSVPPKNEGQPVTVPVGSIGREVAAAAGLELDEIAANAVAHESRIRQALKLFFEGANKALPGSRSCSAAVVDGRFTITVSGTPEQDDFELTKVFKFYYTDALGNPELSLATARLIAEVYGGEVDASQTDGRVSFQFSVPLGEE
jgi:signal transduction histidine kinase